MDKADALKTIAILTLAYPSAYEKYDEEKLNKIAELWQLMFADDRSEEVAAAVKSFIATDVKGFPPSIGQIKEQLSNLRTGENGELTEQEAWALVNKAIRNSGWGRYRKEFSELPPVIQRCIGDPRMLEAWGQMDTETVNSVVASNFMRGYRARAAHIREFEKLPSDVKALYAAVGEVFKLPEAYKEPDPLPALEFGSGSAPPVGFAEIRKKALEAGNRMLQKSAEEHRKTLLSAIGGGVE